MQAEKIVVRFKDKKLMKGVTSNFSHEKNSFYMRLVGGQVINVKLDTVKAAFFVKKLEGNRDYEYKYKDVIPWGGNKIKVEFLDGEVLIGYTQHYFLDCPGFFVTPADLKGNNQRVYVVSSSTENVTFL
ncbi:MAG: hypothetical protein AMK71_04665 [Nitrospira bacterium SG8_35_4]|nr:MAG: hypothetical protein AMK71_04665 [Nitrospira bacterium SG8_35_4]